MTITGVVQEVGAFDRLAAAIEHRARSRSAAQTFAIVFALSAVTSALLNNDAAILILTPLVVALTRRLYVRDAEIATAFAFAVFLAAGVAPFVVSNPMNMIVAEGAGIGFNAYAAVMLPLWIAGSLVTYLTLRRAFRGTLRAATLAPPPSSVTTIHRHAGERPAVALMLAVFVAYPFAAWLRVEIWTVAAGGALAALALCRVYRIAPLQKAVTHVSLDILVFLWGIFLVAQALRSVGAVDHLRALYGGNGDGAGQLAVIGATSAVGSALIDNHPMALLNMMAIDASSDPRPILASLVGGDLGPRLLPTGSLAGLLWIDLLRRAGIDVPLGRFVRIGALAALPALAVSLALLWLL
jgi:arsenical pump membrane protein